VRKIFLLRSQIFKYNKLVPVFASVHTGALNWHNIQKVCQDER